MWWFKLACIALAVATAVLGVSAAPPSVVDLAHCPKSCGGVNISYPFGIGQGCFRPGFEVTCNHNARPPKLFLTNTTTKIVQTYPWGGVDMFIFFNIATRPGAFGSYNRSWKAPGKSLFIGQDFIVVIIGCGVEAFLFDTTSGPGNLLGSCVTMCDDMVALEIAEGGYCNGMACCYIVLYAPFEVHAFRLDIIQKEQAVPVALVNATTLKAFLLEYKDMYTFSILDLLSDKVNESTIGAATVHLWPVITDQPNCQTARMHEQYACAASNCQEYGENVGYWCTCSNENDHGNPYIVGRGGCSEGKYCSSILWQCCPQ
ncbi:hypothetical protein BAE44_0003988 [Dichanthelium oligosanthes]|uniref:Wall-associated receptor kinase galacturonan-binding domain-containing protein n=1 Tax=Dichanthelium oligosanthes TaxID=888268 RepID=A0A1E5WC30_9POAL|nr:hypothetical protein BAE44_0003988 [Dichanthelium oligosanthes]